MRKKRHVPTYTIESGTPFGAVKIEPSPLLGDQPPAWAVYSAAGLSLALILLAALSVGLDLVR